MQPYKPALTAKQIDQVSEFVLPGAHRARRAYIPSRSSIVSLRRHFGAALTCSWR